MSSKFNLTLLLALLLSALDNSTSEQVHFKSKPPCPTWMKSVIGSSDKCACGDVTREIVTCNKNTREVHILDGYIMTYNEAENMVEAGPTIYGWRRKHFDHGRKHLYYLVNQSRFNLNYYACDHLRREGTLCGRCKKGFSPLVYTYTLSCANCSNTRLNVIKFIGAAFIPLTVFYFFVVFFKFNANSPALQAYILGAQMIGAPVVCRYMIAQYGTHITLALLATFLGIWNLDFFRLHYEEICLPLSSLSALSLDYAIAFYPLLLIFLTYTATELHAKGFRIVLILWSPFRLVFRHKWDNKSSLIDVMATFMLLTYNKMLSVSFDLLAFTQPFNLNGTVTGSFLYYDATIVYFGQKHLPFAIMAILFLLIFIIMPFLLLLFYPMKWFQICLNRCKLSHIALHTFVESFTGYYKDGTDPGTRDCRYFASLFLLLRIIFYAALGWTENISFVIIFCSACTFFIILFAMCKPYKAQYSIHNSTTVVMFLAGYALVMCLLGLFISALITDQVIILVTFASVFGIIPINYLTGLVAKWIWTHNPVKKHCHKYIKRKIERSLTTATLFQAADTRDKSIQKYGSM